MDFELEQALEILERTPSVLNQLLGGLSDDWTLKNEGGGELESLLDILGHLIHGEETDWIPRAKIIVEQGEARAFEPFDRFAQLELSRDKSLNELLETFGRLRQRNLEALKALNPTREQWEKRGTHPDLGAVTLGQLLATWVVHDLSHLSQITRVMCRQYDEAVGPWKEYLPILKK